MYGTYRTSTANGCHDVTNSAESLDGMIRIRMRFCVLNRPNDLMTLTHSKLSVANGKHNKKIPVLAGPASSQGSIDGVSFYFSSTQDFTLIPLL